MLLIGLILGALIVPLVANAVIVKETNHSPHSTRTYGIALVAEGGLNEKASLDALMHFAPLVDGGAIRASYGPESPKKTPTRRVLPKNEEDMLAYIKQRESSGNPTAQNPESSAYGLYGFLDSTWETVGCKKTDNPTEQERCAIKYMKERYGGIEGAYYFHVQNDWY